MSQNLCFVCGVHRDEVNKMHAFLTNPEKSKQWQESMRMKYQKGVSLRNYLISNCHFTYDSYINVITRRLRRDVVPKLFLCRFEKNCASQMRLQKVAECDVDDINNKQKPVEEPVASSSHAEASSAASSKAVFRGIIGVSQIRAVCRIGIPWWCRRRNREHLQAHKDSRAFK